MMKPKRSKKPSPYFPKLVEHVSTSWQKKKNMPYPFAGRDFSDLKWACRQFQEWGVMALFDAFMASESDWVRRSGYSIGAFVKCLPWLVDDPMWKMSAKDYEAEMVEPLPPDLFTVVDGLSKELGGRP